MPLNTAVVDVRAPVVVAPKTVAAAVEVIPPLNVLIKVCPVVPLKTAVVDVKAPVVTGPKSVAAAVEVRPPLNVPDPDTFNVPLRLAALPVSCPTVVAASDVGPVEVKLLNVPALPERLAVVVFPSTVLADVDMRPPLKVPNPLSVALVPVI